MIKYIYLVLGICFGVILQTIFIIVDAQSIYCDQELIIYSMNNDLEQLINCINIPDFQQDMRINELENRTIAVEDRLTVLENRTESR